ncbi:MAG: Crp/Fnr family transcriptional regulator [Ginsengibacter sp.]
MAFKDQIQDDSNELFRGYKRLEGIKEYIAGNYTGHRERAIVFHLFDILSGFATPGQKLMDTELLINLVHYLLPLVATSHYARRQLLLSAGHTAEYIYFPQKGMVRGFYTHKTMAKEITEFLWSKGSIITVPNSFFQQQPSEFFIEVMPETELMSISFHDLRTCIEKYPEVEVFSRNVILQYNADVSRRKDALAFLSAWERYLQLLKTHPHIEQQVSKEIIASYLHITPQSLSRMLKERRHP